MGKTAKIILGILGFFVLFCIVGGVLLARFGKQKINGIVEESQQQSTAANTFARTHAQAECMDEGIRRARGCTGLSCQIAVQTFTSTCLSAATPTPGICDGVPHPQDFRSGSIWRNGRCPVTGAQSVPDANTRACQQVTPVLQGYCAAVAARADAGVVTAPTPTPAPTP